MGDRSSPFELPTTLNLDPSARDQPWFRDTIPKLRSQLSKREQSFRLHREVHRNVQVTLLDTFDWKILRRGRALLSMEDRERSSSTTDLVVEKIQRSTEGVASSPAPTVRSQAPRRVRPDIEDRAQRVLSQGELGGRALLELGNAETTQGLWRIVDDRGKTVALVSELVVGSGPSFIRIRPLQGYARIVREILRSLPQADVLTVTDILDTIASSSGRHPFDYDTRLQLPITESDNANTAHKKIVPVLCRTMGANRGGIAEQIDQEFLHDYRVALRRLRGYLREIRTFVDTQDSGTALSAIESVWDASGEARDLDVFLQRRNYYSAIVPASLAQEVETVFDRIETLRDQSYQRLHTVLPQRFEERLEAELMSIEPTLPFIIAVGASYWVDRRERQFLKRVRVLQNEYLSLGGALDDEKIHAARKAAKKYRYLQEIFLPVIAGDSSVHKRVKRLRKLQNLLGDYNDLVVEERRFHDLLIRDKPNSYQDVRGAIAYMLATVQREKTHAREEVLTELQKETR